MPISEFLLLFLTIIFLIGAPFYIFFRLRMVNPHNKPRYSRRVIFKVLFWNLAINIVPALIFLAILISLLVQAENLDSSILLLSIAFFLVISLTFYGNGIYATSIVLEAFTPKLLRKAKSFSTQFTATHLFHGPISHVLVYSGYLLAFFILSMIDLSIGNRGTVSPFIPSAGAVVGIMYAVIQIFNGTLPYQFITSSVLLAILIIYVGNFQNYLFPSIVGNYFFSFLIAFLITGVTYYVLAGRKKKNIWDLSGY